MAAQRLHRPLRFYHLFLAIVGMVLLGLHSSVISANAKYRRSMEESISKPIPVDHGALAAALIPFLGMILMYLALAMGRRLSKLGSHTALRVVFGLALAAGLLYWPSASIAGALKYEEYLREEQPRYQREFGEPFPFEYTFSKNYFCRSADMFYDADGEFLAYCNVNLSMNMISFTAAGLVIVELATAYICGILGEARRSRTFESFFFCLWLERNKNEKKCFHVFPPVHVHVHVFYVGQIRIRICHYVNMLEQWSWMKVSSSSRGCG